jgi:menaquinone-specific isochorismate synthase
VISRCLTQARSPEHAELIAAIPDARGAVCFVQNGSGLVGWGEHAAITVTGADAADQIARWYSWQLEQIDVDDEVGTPGSGPVCFVSLGFTADDPSVAVIPRTVLGRVDGATFLTTIGEPPALTPPAPVTAPGQVRYGDAALSATGFTSAVQQAITRIRAGEAAKVVLAHGLQAVTEHPVDERYLLARLAHRYPSCAAFAVAGLVGASPEMLIRRRGTEVTSRVLAGTAWPERPGAGSGGGADGVAGRDAVGELLARETGTVARVTTDREVAAHLLASSKDLAEHAFAVTSVADTLRGLTSWMDVPAAPRALALANLTHLATDICGRLAGEASQAPSALDLAARLHPTAAVGGTPRDVALAMIAELEPVHRGRYAAPVGWLDARGDGEFAIALRCAEISGTSVRLMAGCGIVADSDPETEAREAQIKMVPVRDALEG